MTSYDTYTVEISVPSAEFSEQGITLDDRRFTAMLHNAFPYVRMSQLNARVLKPTDPKQIEALPELVEACQLALSYMMERGDLTVHEAQTLNSALRKAGVL